jgi:hypothetical protein
MVDSRRDLSRAVLTSSAIPRAVVEVPAVTWRDLGTHERVARSLGAEAHRE